MLQIADWHLKGAPSENAIREQGCFIPNTHSTFVSVRATSDVGVGPTVAQLAQRRGRGTAGSERGPHGRGGGNLNDNERE